jgi:hypothetical protein
LRFGARRTIETQLTSAYRKLDVAGRADLAQALAAADSPRPSPEGLLPIRRAAARRA